MSPHLQDDSAISYTPLAERVVIRMGTLLRLKEYLSREPSDGAQYECLTCHATFERQPQVCPDCGGYDIRSTEWLESGGRPPEERA